MSTEVNGAGTQRSLLLLELRAKEFIEKEHMLKKGDFVVAAVSGGSIPRRFCIFSAL